MSTELVPSADIAIAADYQCEMTHGRLGRCARSSKGSDHHIVLRSHGGHDERRAWLCPVCHDRIHPQPGARVWLRRVLVRREDGEVFDDIGTTSTAAKLVSAGSHEWAYQQVGDDPEAGTVDGDLWELWSYEHVSARWIARAEKAHKGIRKGLDDAEHGMKRAAVWLVEADDKNLWPHMGGFDIDLRGNPVKQYAAAIGYHHKYLEALMRMERNIRQLPEAEQERARAAPSRLMKEVGGAVIEMKPDEREQVWCAVEAGEPTDPIIRSVREGKAIDEAESRGLGRYLFEAHAEGTVAIEVNAESPREAREEARKRILGHKIFNREGVLGVELRNERVERMKR